MRDKSNLKTKSIKAAITPQMEQQIFDYCARYNISVSKLVRQALEFYLNERDKLEKNCPKTANKD